MRLLLTLALLAAAAGCRAKPRPAPEPAADIVLTVTNHHWLDITVYLLHDGQRTRIGLVTGTSEQTFTLPTRTLGLSYELALLGEAVGSRDVARTETLHVRPGQLIEWTLESDLRRSSVGVY